MKDRVRSTLSGNKASQSEYELTSFIQMLIDRGVRSYLEIGARHGDSFYEVMRSLPEGSLGVAVDLPGGLWGRDGTEKALAAAVSKLCLSGRTARLILGDSTNERVIAAIADCGPYDAVFIDGDHTLEGVTKDWVNFGWMAGIIAFHDIVGEGQKEKVHGNQVEVPLLWEELKLQFDHQEFIADGSSMGIGVIYNG